MIDSTLRAMLRDALADEKITANPCAAIPWPRHDLPPADPFTTEDRDRILEWFGERRPLYYPFVATLFLAGLRPSEAVALRWSDVDLAAGRAFIHRSRHLGAESATKTRGSKRTIDLDPHLIEVLRDSKPMHADADSYVFVNRKNGGPIDQTEWPKDHWRPALRALEIRPRKFYATRATFISDALTRGGNLKFLAEYAGTSVAMIEQSYGRFMESGKADELARLFGSPASERSAGESLNGRRNW